MTPRHPPGPRFDLPDLAARFVVFVSLTGVTDFLIATAGLRFVNTGLLVPPAAVLLAWHWPYAAGNRFVLAAVAPLLAYLAFAWSYGLRDGHAGVLLLYLFHCLLMALVAAHVARSSDAAVRGLIGVARLALLVCAASVFALPVAPGTFRPGGFIGNPNEGAMTSVLLLNFVLHRPWNRRLLNWFAGAAAAVTILLTLSRTGIALLVLTFLLFLWIRRKWMILSVTSVAVLWFLATPQPFLDAVQQGLAPWLQNETNRMLQSRLENVTDLLEGRVVDMATGFRSTLWIDGIALILDTFPHGSGFGSFQVLEGSVFLTRAITESQWLGVHNMYLLIAGEAGFVVFALLVFCYGGLVAAACFPSRDRLPLAIVVATLIFWINTDNFLDHRYHVVAFAVAVGLLARNRAGRGRTAFDAGDAAPRRTA